jgi:hypothetical protein
VPGLKLLRVVKNSLGKKLLTIKEQTDRVEKTYKFSSNLGTPDLVKKS